ncbi:MAG TPA: FtsH protease activity modulator HflK, partial [Paracoccus sp.]|nr:FtsH protease activity modulator HflK [Paracoccus sp. (in: a-proteobacteria)]
RDGGARRPGGPRGPRPEMPRLNRGQWGIFALGAVALWAFASVYQVDTSEKSVELLFGRPYAVRDDGLNFAPWPFVTKQIVGVTRERTIDIGVGRDPMDSGLMLTRDQNIVDITYQVVWNVSNPEQYLFNLADPEGTIRAVAESAMRDIVARSELSPILNRDRGVIQVDLEQAIQATLDSYQAGINVLRVNLGRADPPGEVIDSFREVQAAQQERDRLEKEADAYANRVLAAARGEAAALVEQSEAYRAQAVNGAQGEAARFISVYDEYIKAPDVTRRRMYLETMEKVLGGIDKVLIDSETGQGVVPYLPLDQLRNAPPPQNRAVAPASSSNTTQQGGN